MELSQTEKQKIQIALREKNYDPSVLIPYSVISSQTVEAKEEDILMLVEMLDDEDCSHYANSVAHLLGQLIPLSQEDHSYVLGKLSRSFAKGKNAAAADALVKLSYIFHQKASKTREMLDISEAETLFQNVLGPITDIILDDKTHDTLRIKAVETFGRIMPTTGYCLDELHIELYKKLLPVLSNITNCSRLRTEILASFQPLAFNSTNGWVVIGKLDIVEKCYTTYTNKTEPISIRSMAGVTLDLLVHKVPPQLWRKVSQIETPGYVPPNILGK